MKITKYPQSNFLIEEAGGRILIDPGNFTFEKYSIDDFHALDAILITHQHPDHLDKEAVKALKGLGTPVYGNSDVASVLGESSVEVNVVESNKELVVAGFKVKPLDLPHCKMLDGSPGPPNTGFVVGGTLFHPGDGIEIAGLEVENAAIPIAGPTIDYDRAWKLAASLQAKRVIPMHYSSPRFPADPQEFAKANLGKVEVIILADGSSTEIA